MIRVLLMSFVLVLGVAGRAGALPLLFTASLDGPSEAPPNASPATGSALVVIDDVAHILSVTIDFMDLLGTTTASHIHVINGPGDSNVLDTAGPVATTTPTFPGFPLDVTSGSYGPALFDTTLAATYRPGWIADSGGIGPAEAALFDAIVEGRAYVNIHTTVFPGGEIRGFLRPAAAPEPALLLLLGTGMAATLRRSRRGPSR
jgi:hypothetical protein